MDETTGGSAGLGMTPGPESLPGGPGDVGTAVGVAPHSAAGDILTSLGDLLDLGGPIVAILLALSVVALTIVIAKLLQFARFGRRNRRACARAVGMWCRGNIDTARQEIAALGGPIAGVLRVAMDGLAEARDAAHVRERVEQAASQALAASRSYLRGLEAIAQAAPLLGLLGTVIGMIDAFKVLEASGGDVDPAGLAGGIWVALLTTAVGLGVAIPISFVLHWFDARVDVERQELERLATAVLTHPPRPAPPREADPVPIRPMGARIHAG
jgi:biopolymer transport protein ExbB